LEVHLETALLLEMKGSKMPTTGKMMKIMNGDKMTLVQVKERVIILLNSVTFVR